MLKWNERFMQYESNKSLEETIGVFEGYAGCYVMVNIQCLSHQKKMWLLQLP